MDRRGVLYRNDHRAQQLGVIQFGPLFGASALPVLAACDAVCIFHACFQNDRKDSGREGDTCQGVYGDDGPHGDSLLAFVVLLLAAHRSVHQHFLLPHPLLLDARALQLFPHLVLLLLLRTRSLRLRLILLGVLAEGHEREDFQLLLLCRHCSISNIDRRT